MWSGGSWHRFKMDALILAAGFGTRMYPLTKNLAKGLIKINDKPLIEHSVKKLEQVKEIENIYILSNNKFYVNFLEWLEDFKLRENIGKKIKLLNNGINSDNEKKGAVNDLKYALSLANSHDLIVLASDNLFNFNINELVELGKTKNSSTVVGRKVEDINSIKKYSCILIDENSKLIFFEEKPQNPKSNIMATACYFLKKSDLEKIKHHEFEKADNLGNIIEFLHKSSIVHAKIFQDFWCDIGSLKELEKVTSSF